MRAGSGNSPLLVLILGLWLGGSIAIWGVVTYNFSGVEHLFRRNPELAGRAGFDPGDEAAKKASLLWVHSSEINRAIFEVWGAVQLPLGALALGVALWRRQGRAVAGTILLALLLAAAGRLALIPEIVQLGRTLDFQPRTPPPPGLADFGRLHGIHLIADLVRGLALVAAAALALRRSPAPPADVPPG